MTRVVCYTKSVQSGRATSRLLVENGFTGVILLIIVVILVVAGGAFYFGRQSNSLPANTATPLSSPIPTPGSLSPSDISAIKVAIYKREGQSSTEIKVNFDTDDPEYQGLFATGQVGPASGEGGGARWIAAKVNNEWVIVDISQVGLACDLAVKYNIPIKMVPRCNGENDEVVDR